MELQLFLTLLLVLMSWFLAQDLEDRAFFGWWTLGWAAMLVQLVLGAVYLAGTAAESWAEALVFALISVFGMLQVAFFLLGGRRLLRGEELAPRRRARILAAAVAVGIASGAAGAASLPDVPLAQSLQMGARNLGLAMVFPWCAVSFYRSRRFRVGAAAACIVAGFLLYGGNQAVYAAGAVHDLADRLLELELPGPGVGVMLSDWAFVADVSWEALIGAGTILLLRREGREARRALARSEERYRELFEHSVDGIFLADASLRIVEMNRSLREMLGWRDDPPPRLSVPDLLAPDARDELPALDAVRQGDGMSLETEFRGRDGGPFPVEVSLTFYDLDGREVLQGIVRDITARKALEERLAHQARHHPLTGLPNRYHFRREIGTALARLRRSGERFGLLFLDVDGLKEVNDTLGHPAGDDLLVAVGRRLRRGVREADSTAHVGGDEFTVLLHGCSSSDELRRAGRRVLSAVEGPCEVGGKTVDVGVSVGGALAGPDDDPDDVLARADRAMYRAKDAGPGADERVPVARAPDDAPGA